MTALAYTVIATFPDEDGRDRYVAWLRSGHLDAVIGGGAVSALIVVLEEPARPLSVESRYIFPDRDTFATYERIHAPALREDGLRRFGPETGVRFERRIGQIVS